MLGCQYEEAPLLHTTGASLQFYMWIFCLLNICFHYIITVQVHSQLECKIASQYSIFTGTSQQYNKCTQLLLFYNAEYSQGSWRIYLIIYCFCDLLFIYLRKQRNLIRFIHRLGLQAASQNWRMKSMHLTLMLICESKEPIRLPIHGS